MDMLTVDLGEVWCAQLGDDVTLLDNDPLSPVSAYALARWSDTIPYEVFCRIGKVRAAGGGRAGRSGGIWRRDSRLLRNSQLKLRGAAAASS